MAWRILPQTALGLRGLGAQFQGLDRGDPSAWPAAPRWCLYAALTAAVLAALWFVWLTNLDGELDAERARETTLKAGYRQKITQAAPLESLEKQHAHIRRHVAQLEQQLPGKADMDALLSGINQAGLDRNLQFELFRPGQAVIQDDYAELPIAVRVTGRYHDMGAFAADVANLPRIVTLNSVSVTPRKDGALVMDATARTYRHLDEDERNTRKRALAAKKKK
jgi:type IV pilus assembly protein PilO